MRLLSVANVASLLGGTGACCLECVNALSEWQHSVVFVTGQGQGLEREFGCPVRVGQNAICEAIERFSPDLVLWHNTTGERMPQKRCPWIYYQHSHFSGAAVGRRRCDEVLCVSRYLAAMTGLPESSVVYQPVTMPPRVQPRAAGVVVGRLCTPSVTKWGKNLPQFYEMLARSHPDVQWEFVGCPAAMQEPLQAACRGQATFHPASREARSLLWRWHALVYSGGPETYGRTVHEAQLCGCVPIVDAQGGFREQIRDGVDGVLAASMFGFHSGVEAVCCGREWYRLSCTAMAAAAERGEPRAWATRFESLVSAKKEPARPARA